MIAPSAVQGAAAAVLAVGLAWGVAVAQAPTAGDGMAAPPAAALAARGQSIYASSCGFCHGAEGGGAQGPGLVSSPYFTASDRGQVLADFLKVGRPATGMPPFPDIASADVEAMHAFIRGKRGSVASRPPLDPASIVVGDAAAGRAYFNGEGGCARCHDPEKDLKGVGSRYNPLILQGRMINPRVVGLGRNGPAKPPPPARVRVTPSRGGAVSGALVQQNDLSVTLVDDAGVRRTFLRADVSDVQVDDPLEAHRQHMLRWTDRNMWNVTAYLVSLK